MLNTHACVTVTISAKELYGSTTLGLKLISDKADAQPNEIEGFATRENMDEEVKYRATFDVPADFGEVGAVSVTNDYDTEMYIKNIILEGLPYGRVEISCNSWVHSKNDNSDPRVFFTNKSYLPSQTPSGLKKLRKEELEKLRGDGNGKRKRFERIYDYDTYNDLGDPENDKLIRPVLGGKKFPYPRRCRTGRPVIERGGEFSETRVKDEQVYVPRDENFSDIKDRNFQFTALNSTLHEIIPQLRTLIADSEFPYFTAIELLYDEGINLPLGDKHDLLEKLLRFISSCSEIGYKLLRFELPESFKRDRFSWLNDQEFARQTLAGMNPLSIKRVTEWPLKSSLDDQPDSAFSAELVEKEMNSNMTVEEALEDNRLFIIDYHDALLPYVNKVRDLKDTTLYGSRTLFFLDDDRKTLRPLAIELTRPPTDEKPDKWSKVYTPGTCATTDWLWKLAKAHVLAHDTGYHQLISHWLRTHCCTEPYIIAANRCLSAMHPIYRLLHPYFRYTMEINALARKALISADGIIEKCFTPRKYCMELSSVIYGLEWRFDHEALPADLIRREMAIKDPSKPHGLDLVIDDYPYAKDGLDLWATIKEWVTDYVNHYYPDPSLVESDDELIDWWTDVRTKGHGDKKDELWWPTLKTLEDLIHILTTIIWVTSGHHAAVNFGQYTYAGYFPNRPTIARTKMPDEDSSDEEMKKFSERPEETLLKCFPTQNQATTVMTVLDVLSNHSPDEEYLGATPEPSWEASDEIMIAFRKFNAKLEELDAIIEERNNNIELVNRNGVGVLPYELLMRQSKCGVTSKGVPNSITI